jgi:hypothetical protein
VQPPAGMYQGGNGQMGAPAYNNAAAPPAYTQGS